jgi:hypothetical protein
MKDISLQNGETQSHYRDEGAENYKKQKMTKVKRNFDANPPKLLNEVAFCVGGLWLLLLYRRALATK